MAVLIILRIDFPLSIPFNPIPHGISPIAKNTLRKYREGYDYIEPYVRVMLDI